MNQYGMPFNQFQYPNGYRSEVVRVTGVNGARAYQLAPNSSILLLDETAPIIWLCVTDGAGYKTVTAYDITPHEKKQETDIKTLEGRIQRLEALYDESHVINTKQEQQARTDRPVSEGYQKSSLD